MEKEQTITTEALYYNDIYPELLAAANNSNAKYPLRRNFRIEPKKMMLLSIPLWRKIAKSEFYYPDYSEESR